MLREFKILRDYTLAGVDGEIGKLREFYFDDEHWAVRYFVIETGSWLFGKPVLAPPGAFEQVDAQARTIAVGLTKKQLRTAPPVEFARQQSDAVDLDSDCSRYWKVPAAADIAAMKAAPVIEVGSTGDAETDDKGLPKQNRTEAMNGHLHLPSSAELMSGYTFATEDGEVGSADDFILDDEEWQVRYLVVRTGAWFSGKNVLLSPEWVESISASRAEIFVNVPLSSITNAPEYDPAAPIDRAFEERLHAHYGRKAYWDTVEAIRK